MNAPGGFAELMAARADRCFRVDDLPVETAVLAEPTACVVHGLDVLGMAPGSRVLIFGAGPTGLILAQAMAGSGAGHLTVAAPTRAKLDLATRGGADEVVLVDRAAPGSSVRRLREIAPDGFEVVVDATGAVPVLEQTIGLTRIGGTVFVYGMAAEQDRWAVAPYEIFRRELTLKGSFAQQFSFDRALGLLRSGRVDPTGMITHRFTLEEYDRALAAVADSSCVKAIIVPT